MGIKGDIDEVRVLWIKAPPLLKVFLAISLFLTVSSVASLSNAVFAWKGFIREGIEFYSYWIAGTISKIAKNIGFAWNREEIDALIIMGLFSGSYVRELWVAFRLSRKKSDFWLAVVFSVLIPMMHVHIGYNFASATNEVHWKWFIILTGGVAVAIFFGFGYSRRERVVFFFPIIIAILIVLVLGAINAGLQR